MRRRLGVHAATPASTLADLCPGTSDPCVVTGQFDVTPGTTFDLGGRALRVPGGARISAAAGGFQMELRARGDAGGANSVAAHDSLVVAGALNAVFDGANSLTYRNTTNVTGSILPAASAVQDGALSECVAADPDL